jgi:poly(3-hydroxybutyrate) depolymerase
MGKDKENKGNVPGRPVDLGALLQSQRGTKTLDQVAQETRDRFAGVCIEGHLLGKGSDTFFMGTAEKTVWEIPVDAILAASEAEPTAPYLGGDPVAVRIKAGALVRVVRTLEIGKDIVSAQRVMSDDTSRDCGPAPSGCNGKCCPKGWCCSPYTQCCGGGCCRP